VGSSIQFVETLVNVNSITFQTTGPPIDISPDYVEYPVIVVEEGVALPTVGEATTMTAIVTGALATDFVGIPAGWTGNEPIWADVTSYLAFDGVDQGADPTNQYGISLLVQRINISDDWDFLADSGGGGGGGGGGTDPAELVGYLGEAFPRAEYCKRWTQCGGHRGCWRHHRLLHRPSEHTHQSESVVGDSGSAYYFSCGCWQHRMVHDG
jgi:hypothetical protein